MPDVRLQSINDDVVLEVSETTTTKVRHSKNAMLRQKTYLEDAISTFSAQLAKVNEVLALIENEEGKTADPQ